MSVEIQGLSKRQCQIADMLWVADASQLKTILRMFGDEARVVQNMMIAAVLDQNTDTDLAKSVLDQFRV